MSFLLLEKLFGIVSWPFKAFFGLLTTNPKAAAVLVLVAALAFGGWKIDRYITDINEKEVAAEQAKEKAEKEKAQLQTALDTAVQVNHDNQAVITQLQQQAAITQARVDQLNTQLTKNTVKFQTILDSIKNAPATDDGPVAPVLARTIDQIQKERVEQ